MLAVAAAKQKAGGAAPRLRNRATATRVPPPAHNGDLVGMGIEFGFEFHEPFEVKAGGALVGSGLRKEFDGQFFGGVVLSGSGVDGDPYAVQYDDGDGEEMATAEVEPLLTGATHAVGSTWASVRHLYGEILEVATTRTRVGRSKKTTTKALFYVRWDRGIYEDDDDESAMEWLEVQPKNHGVDGKDGWEVVPLRQETHEGEGACESESGGGSESESASADESEEGLSQDEGEGGSSSGSDSESENSD